MNDGAAPPTLLDIPGFAGQCFWSTAASVLTTHLHLPVIGFGLDLFLEHCCKCTDNTFAHAVGGFGLGQSEDKCSDKALASRFGLQGSVSGALLQVY